MTMILRCDICDEEFDLEAMEGWAEFKLPANWMPVHQEATSEVVKLDICSVDCLVVLAKALNPVPDEPSGPEPDNDDEPDPGPWQQPRPDFEITVR